jgi:hypothetical protein
MSDSLIRLPATNVTLGEARSVLEALDLMPSELSPLVEVSPEAEVSAGSQQFGITDLSAWWVLSAPERLIVAQRRVGGEVGRMSFLQAEDVIVRCDIQGDRLSLAGPLSPTEFADVICDVAEIQVSTMPVDATVTHSMLLSVAALVAATGPGSIAPIALTPEAALQALARALDDGVPPPERLGGLIDGDVLREDGGQLRSTPDFADAFGCLFSQDRLDLCAYELADAPKGFHGYRMFTILGAGSERRLARIDRAPATTSPRPIRLRSPARELVLAEVLRLTSDPWSPLLVPSSAHSDEELPASSKHGWDGGWSCLDTAQIDDLEAPTPRSLAHPRVTIELVTHRRSGEPIRRRVISIGDADAVEWIPEGSRVAWRGLSAATIEDHIAALWAVPAGLAERLPLTSVQLASLLGVATNGALPPILDAIRDDPEVEWSRLRVRVPTADGQAVTRVLLARSERAGGWLLQEDDETMIADGCDTHRFRDTVMRVAAMTSFTGTTE